MRLSELTSSCKLSAFGDRISTNSRSFLAIFADVATIAVAYDRAPYARKPVEWQLPKVWIMSTIVGLLLAAGTWIMRATMFTDSRGVIQNFGSIQGVLFLEVALTESWIICKSWRFSDLMPVADQVQSSLALRRRRARPTYGRHGSSSPPSSVLMSSPRCFACSAGLMADLSRLMAMVATTGLDRHRHRRQDLGLLVRSRHHLLACL